MIFNESVDKIIVVDPGKNTVKVLAYNKDFTLVGYTAFPSKSKKKRNFYDIDSSSDLQFLIEHNELKFMIGEGVLADYNFETTKNTHHHKMCVYTAISNFVTKEDENIFLIVGYPSSDYANIDQRKEYIELLQESNPINFTINENNKRFNIVGLSVKPEGVAMKPRVEKVGNNKVKNIDIGGENINYRYYDEKGNTLESESLDGVGVNHLEAFIKTRLRKFVNVKNIDLNTINYLNGVKNGILTEIRPEDLSNYANSKEFITDVVEEFVEEQILDSLEAKDVSLQKRGDKILFTGGGSVLLQNYLKTLLQSNVDNLIFSDTAYWDNCISYIIKEVSDQCKLLDGDKMQNMQLAQFIAAKILKDADVLKQG